MLFLFFFKVEFIVLVQSGFYFDFFFKKLCEVFLKNFFIYSSLFFGEKYIIEVFTKKIIDNYVFFANKQTYSPTLKHNSFFNIIIQYVFFALILVFIMFYIF